VRRIALKIEYDGTGFLGWQLQRAGRTVQGALEDAAGRATDSQRRLPVHGAGRTDAGVHALGQVAHFDTDSALPAEVLLRAVNHWLPKDVSVLGCWEVPQDFHSRFTAVSKIYRYRVLPCSVRRPMAERYCLREPGPLDLAAMQQCACLIEGSHDFASFATEKREGQNTLRTVLRSEWREQGGELQYWVEADGFLYNMVRALVGAMLDAGRGRLSACEFRRIMEARDRRTAGRTAPPHGLTLVEVKYRDGARLPAGGGAIATSPTTPSQE